MCAVFNQSKKKTSNALHKAFFFTGFLLWLKIYLWASSSMHVLKGENCILKKFAKDCDITHASYQIVFNSFEEITEFYRDESNTNQAIVLIWVYLKLAQ